MKKYFITGISTEVGKTIAAAIITESLQADYWKPIQAGDLKNSDSHKIKRLISNNKTKIHKNSYTLNTPMSPHAAAKIDGITIDINNIKEPKTTNNLVIEGAGGIFVPLNNTKTIMDIIDTSYKIIVVSRHYLGSINHTLLTLELLKQKGFEISILFNGNENIETESIIEKISGIKILGRIEEEPYFDKNVILEYATKFKSRL